MGVPLAAGGDEVVEIGPLSGILRQRAVPDLTAFVDRIAAHSDDEITTAASEQLKQLIEQGSAPPGIRLLAEATATASRDRPPPPRRPGDDPAVVVDAVRGSSYLVLEEFGPEAVAAAVAGLVNDGRRVVVTANRATELAAVRAAMPSSTDGRCLDVLPVLPADAVRRLRNLLATATPVRPDRARQRVPTADAVPPVTEVAELCRRATRTSGRSSGSVGATPDPAALIPDLLNQLEHDRRLTIVGAAQHVERALAAVRARQPDTWAWSLLTDLAHSRRWSDVEQLTDLAANAVALAEPMASAPSVSYLSLLPPGSRELLTRYQEFLQSGGRPRAVFRSGLQREVEPLLALIRIDDRPPETADDIALVLRAIELDEHLGRLRAACHELGIPVPQEPGHIPGLLDLLNAVAAAARAVATLRHEVRFVRPELPIVVPDLPTAERVAAAIRENADQNSPEVAATALRRMAEVLESGCPPQVAAPELNQVVEALRSADATAYHSAVAALAEARREIVAAQQLAELLEQLAEQAPSLATTIATFCANGPAHLGFAAFVPIEQLLVSLPPADSADVVVVLEAHRVGRERLLLAGVAPRLIGTVGRAGRDARVEHSLSSALHALSALVIRGAGQIVRMPTQGARSRRKPTNPDAADRAGA